MLESRFPKSSRSISFRLYQKSRVYCGVGEDNNGNEEDRNHDGRDHINNDEDLAGE